MEDVKAVRKYMGLKEPKKMKPRDTSEESRNSGEQIEQSSARAASIIPRSGETIRKEESLSHDHHRS